MNSHFRLENLSALPFAVRRTALAAVRGSHADWKKLTEIIRADSGVAAHKFLPVVFATLDPELVPKQELLTLSDIMPLACALRALEAIYLFADLPAPVLEALWPRVWMWSGLLAEYRASDELLRYLWPFCKEKAIKSVVHSTPGTHAFIARAWPLLSSQFTQSNPVTVVYEFLRHCDEACSHHLREFAEEFVDPSILAALVVRQINQVVAACVQPKVSQICFFCNLQTLTEFVRLMGTLDLFPPFLSAGIIRAHTSAIARLTIIGAEGPVQNSFIQLRTLLVSSPGYPHLPEALKAGLLESILSFGARYQPSQRIEALVGDFLRSVLPGSLVYYRAVSALAAAYHKISSRPYNDRFLASPIYKDWVNFSAILRERLRVLEYFQSSEYAPTKACDNLECGVIRAASEFKRCAGCREHFYCSRRCHTVDWKHGGHRELCKLSNRPDFLKWTKRDDAFLRHILHRDYQTNKFDILGKQLAYLLSYGGRRNFCTTFDYTSGRCAISVQTIPPINSSGAGFTERQIAAAAYADSRLGLHRVILEGGRQRFVRHYVLRSSSAALAIGLEEIRVFTLRLFVKRTERNSQRNQLRVLSKVEVLETHG
ncbi:hypothetical protein DFH06DRAFT_1206108 [Mycena polygramma]|nr:hypothetical protein DFH06DRAFT_1206108 [Mycena polygramma]